MKPANWAEPAKGTEPRSWVESAETKELRGWTEPLEEEGLENRKESVSPIFQTVMVGTNISQGWGYGWESMSGCQNE